MTKKQELESIAEVLIEAGYLLEPDEVPPDLRDRDVFLAYRTAVMDHLFDLSVEVWDEDIEAKAEQAIAAIPYPAKTAGELKRDVASMWKDVELLQNVKKSITLHQIDRAFDHGCVAHSEGQACCIDRIAEMMKK